MAENKTDDLQNGSNPSLIMVVKWKLFMLFKNVLTSLKLKKQKYAH